MSELGREGLAPLRDPIPCPLGSHPVGGRLRGLDDRLARFGGPGWQPLTPWWLEALSGFYASGARIMVDRVGRRGRKSTSLCRVAVLEGLYGDHEQRPTDVNVVVAVSVDKDEAKDRLATIRAILDVLGEPYAPTAYEIRLKERPVVFAVFAGSVAAVSGFTSIAIFCDEVAKWRDEKTGRNPGTEVLAALRPTMATRPNARMFLSSSAVGNMDAHAKAFDEGNTATQRVYFAPSWVANPIDLTEASTHELEPNEDIWRREYAGIPIEGSDESLFSGATLARYTRAEGALPPKPLWHYVAAMDPATRGNGWTLVIATTDGERKIVVDGFEWRGSSVRPLDPDAVFCEIAAILKPYKVRIIDTDHWSVDTLASIARKNHDLILSPRTLSQTKKLELYEKLARDLAHGIVELMPHKQMRADLLSVIRIVTTNGITLSLLSTPDGRHSDFAPALLLALDAYCAPPDRTFEEEQIIVAESIAKTKKSPANWWSRAEENRKKNLANRVRMR